MTAEKATIYNKLGAARKKFHGLKLTKTGQNKFAKYDYFELGDFLIPAMDCLYDEGLVSVITFNEDSAYMYVFDVINGESITLTSPMAGADLPNCHPIQNLGAVQTYQRRYLWVSLMEIVEHDALDATTGQDEPPKTTKKVTKKVAKKAAAKKPEAPQDDFLPTNVSAEIHDAEGAADVANMIIGLATSMEPQTKSALINFWKSNLKVIDLLDSDWHYEFERVKAAMTELKDNLQEQ